MRALVLIFALLFACPAYAADFSLCGDYAAIVKALKERGENQVLAWAEKDGTLRVFFGHPKDKTWTLAVFGSDGQGCTMRNGKNFILDAS